MARAAPVTPAQLREARRLLGWSAERLGAFSETAAYVVRTFELTGKVIPPPAHLAKGDRLAGMRSALEEAGVEFTAVGVRLRGAVK